MTSTILFFLLFGLFIIIVAVRAGDDTTLPSSGLTYKLYDNAALIATKNTSPRSPAEPTHQGITSTAKLSLLLVSVDDNKNKAVVDNDDFGFDDDERLLLSGELIGSIYIEQYDGLVQFYCIFNNTSTGWVHLDGYLICHDNNVYNPTIRRENDNQTITDYQHDPIPLYSKSKTRIGRSPRKLYPLRAQIMSNKTDYSRADDTYNVPSLEIYWKKVNDNNDNNNNNNEFQLLGMTNNQNQNSKAKAKANTTLSDSNSDSIISAIHLHPYLSYHEQRRDKLQRNSNISKGWGYWLRGNIMSIIKLPEGLVISFKVCYYSSDDSSISISISNNKKQHRRHQSQSQNHKHKQCLSSAVTPDSKDIIRVDTHTYDRSYISYNLTYSPNQIPSSSSLSTSSSINISLQMECSISGKNKDQLRYMITVIDYNNINNNNNNDGINKHNDGYNGDFFLEIKPRYAWFRPGTITKMISNSNSPSSATNTSTNTNTNTSAPSSSNNVVGFSFQTPGLGITNFTTTTTTTTTAIVNDIMEGVDSIDIISEQRHRSLLGRSNLQVVEAEEEEEEYSKDDGITLTIPLTKMGQKVGFISNVQCSSDVNKIESYIHNMKDKERIRLYEKYGDNNEEEVVASSLQQIIQAAVMWTMIYNPIENGPFSPVSRSNNWSWQSRSNAVTDDWTYVIFEWDNFFVSLLAGFDNKYDIAYSNLFQVIKTKTVNNFIPNWSAGGGVIKSSDRTEPPIGGRVLLELYKKYPEDNNKWLIELLWDDIYEWNNWFINNRLLQPLGLISVGSYYSNKDGRINNNIINNMQAARYESGLDNSPMYDGNNDIDETSSSSSSLYNNTTHMMDMYDVGMSSLVAHEAYCLLILAEEIGGIDPNIISKLRRRGDMLRDRIFKYLWNPNEKIFANRYRHHHLSAAGNISSSSSAFVPHITPTSFYPLLLLSRDDLQNNVVPPLQLLDNKDYDHVIDINDMITSWLLNSTRFCITPNGDFDGNDPNHCYWGLPSGSADDPTYMVPGQWNYWRGLSWGPMSQIVYWSLQGKPIISYDNYNNDILASLSSSSARSIQKNNVSSSTTSSKSIIDGARKALCRQMEALVISQWKANRHICENYSPFLNSTECSGTLFYHWGALHALIGMTERGYY